MSHRPATHRLEIGRGRHHSRRGCDACTGNVVGHGLQASTPLTLNLTGPVQRCYSPARFVQSDLIGHSSPLKMGATGSLPASASLKTLENTGGQAARGTQIS